MLGVSFGPSDVTLGSILTPFVSLLCTFVSLVRFKLTHKQCPRPSRTFVLCAPEKRAWASRESRCTLKTPSFTASVSLCRCCCCCCGCTIEWGKEQDDNPPSYFILRVCVHVRASVCTLAARRLFSLLLSISRYRVFVWLWIRPLSFSLLSLLLCSPQLYDPGRRLYDGQWSRRRVDLW